MNALCLESRLIFPTKKDVVYREKSLLGVKMPSQLWPDYSSLAKLRAELNLSKEGEQLGCWIDSLFNILYRIR